MEPEFTSIEAAVEYLTSSEELYAIDEVDIRGIHLKVFANAATHVGELLNLCDDYGDAEFLVFENERYTFTDFKDRVDALAKALQFKYGVSKGERVAICMRNYPEYLIAIMAIASLGAITVFLNSWWTTSELEYGFTDSEARLVLADGPSAERIAPFSDQLGITYILVRSEAKNQINYSDLMAETYPEPQPITDIHADDDMAIMYTSGSTGHPKGVVQTHRGTISAVMSWVMSGRIADLMGTTLSPPTDKTGKDLQPASLITTPLFHVSATHACFLLGLVAGAKLVIMNKWNAEQAVNFIEQENITRFFGVPTMSADLVETARQMGKTLDTIRSLDAGGAKRPASQVGEIVEAFPHADPRTGYGLTETNGLGLGIGGKDYVDQPGVAGHLYPPLQEMRIVANNGTEVPRGKVGEITLRSAANMRCYLNKPSETEQALKHGWLYTGDLGTVNEQGIVTIVDRKKDIIIRGGENISCLEVDAALHRHKAIAEAAVFSIPHERLGETIGAGVQLYPGKRLTEADLQEFLRKHLSAFKVPEKVWFLEALPRGATEKTDRRALRIECLGKDAGTLIVST